MSTAESLIEPSQSRPIESAASVVDEPSLALCIRDLRKDYQLSSETVHVLKGINLDVPRGDYIAIMGPSGSGKSTLLNLLGGLDTPTSGQYLIGHCDVAQLSDDELSAIRAQRIGFVFQAYNLLPQLNVLENMEVPLAYNGGMTAGDRDRTVQLAKLVGLDDRVDHRPTELSGGQQQRAGIARSLINQPEFILADEATGNLDTGTTEEILDLFDNLNDQGATIVMVTHEEEVAQRARRIVRLRDGVVEQDERLRPPSAADADAGKAGAGQGKVRSGRPSQLRLRARDIRVGIKTLLMHPLRSMLTVLGIFIGVASVIWLLAISEGIASKANQQIEELGANNILLTTSRPSGDDTQGKKIYFYGLTEIDCDHLEASIPSVEMAIAFCRRNSREFRYADRVALGEINACTPEYKDLYSLHIARGRFLVDKDNENSSNVCVVTQELARTLFRHEDPIGKSVQIVADFYRVVGVVGSRTELETVKGTSRGQDFSDNIYIPLNTYWLRYGDSTSFGNNGERAVSQITLRLRDAEDAVATGKAVEQTLKRTHLYEDYTVGIPLELLEQAQNTRLMFMAMMGLLASISLLVGGIGIMNIMLATVTERTREIGIRRALGARRRDITRQFLIETILLSVGGGITGILGGLTCGKLMDSLRWMAETTFPDLMKSLPETVQSMEPVIIPWSIPIAFGISVTVGIIFGIYPALRAAAMNPIEALRHVG
ncbi:ABC transporter permease [Novipirellula artificiosorum]|uniref:Macrolide export ATP-binding/permease protein MacB n=1 Tax=Novipirellula artificiosorum TaxID=2528016 RepID=A0A5C6DB29_9BACT|nr:ABC transporter permease [Novipirellula artificiosorum]TWU33024.1 Macrolide export ATP-binding/permease protein MacB [Novipirellula artificiosorum]